ncbi:hypothetical protein [Reinekea thalattae]|uniref:Uncharacterized protein n=1 Tax=Reinekea thalattae TaxID=2593301 RepID=A0A5C8ZA68_9GAMM|nr:hypothetical protein [Reinekea thalattae]TXR53776.1 hypothetical protein FME95_04240 [Reinekea thalattae]
MSARNKVVLWLKEHTENSARAIRQFTTGGFIFSFGLFIIILAERLIPPSLQQELAALLGLLLLITGAAIALWGYLSLSLFKIALHLLDKEEPKTDDSSARH